MKKNQRLIKKRLITGAIQKIMFFRPDFPRCFTCPGQRLVAVWAFPILIPMNTSLEKVAANPIANFLAFAIPIRILKIPSRVDHRDIVLA